MLTTKNTTREGRGRSGQALVIIVITIIGLIGMTGLVVDGGRTFVDRQGAQSSADSAALAAAVAKANKPSATASELEKAAKAIATTNGYDPDTVTVLPITTTTGSLTATFTGCNGTTNSYTDTNSPDTKSTYIQVKIVTQIDTSFAKLVGINQMGNCVDAIARAKPGTAGTTAQLYSGNAIVSLNPSTTTCGIDTGNSGSKVWTLTGGGIFSNGCIDHSNGTLTISNGQCLSAVGGIIHSGGGTHTCVQPNQAGTIYTYPEDVLAMMPPNPCTGAITGVDPNRVYAGGGKIPVSGQTTYNNGVFCISNVSTLDADIVLTNATLYVTQTNFNLKFAGGGGFFGTATTTAGSPYKGYYMIMPLLSKAEADSCKQTIDFRGNGNLVIVGTILAPSLCLDYRGNSAATTIRSQFILYNLSSNGTADLILNYAAADNATKPIPPTQAFIELTK